LSSRQPLSLGTAALIALATLAGAPGCYVPDYGDGGFSCTEGREECPDGYQCVDHTVCVKSTIDPSTLPTIVVTIAGKTTDGAPIPVKPGEKLTAQIAVTNFKLVDFSMGATNVAGEGHYHAYLDDYDHRVAMSYKAQVEIPLPSSLSPSAHELIFVLASNQHQPLPLARAQIALDVTAQ
jgi:hypothetical protein